MSQFIVALLVVLLAAPAHLAFAGCMNCGSGSRSTDTVEEPAYEEVDDDDRSSSRSSGSLRSKIRRLDDDRVDDLVIPVLFDVALHNITDNFGDPRGGGTRSHEGLDMLAPIGTPIVSPTDAVVTNKGTWSGSGLFVTTANPGDEKFEYLHLDKIAKIRTGDVLKKGDLIGFVGDTGNAKGGPAHLHFEIRDGRKALDPYPRISKEFSLKAKMSILEDILDDYNDDDYVEFLAETFESVFIHTQATGIDVPKEILRELPARVRDASLGTRILEIGMEGTDVSVLQSLLIQKGHLAISEPTGYFGPLTQAAVRSYQRENDIRTTGNFGPITRASIQGGATARPAPARSTVATEDEGVDLADLVELFLALGIIPEEKREAAFAALNAA